MLRWAVQEALAAQAGLCVLAAQEVEQVIESKDAFRQRSLQEDGKKSTLARRWGDESHDKVLCDMHLHGASWVS